MTGSISPSSLETICNLLPVRCDLEIEGKAACRATNMIGGLGAVYEQNLGKDTLAIASMITFNPDDRWKSVKAPRQGSMTQRWLWV
jgi:hypothetical protein